MFQFSERSKTVLLQTITALYICRALHETLDILGVLRSTLPTEKKTYLQCIPNIDVLHLFSNWNLSMTTYHLRTTVQYTQFSRSLPFAHQHCAADHLGICKNSTGAPTYAYIMKPRSSSFASFKAVLVRAPSMLAFKTPLAFMCKHSPRQQCRKCKLWLAAFRDTANTNFQKPQDKYERHIVSRLCRTNDEALHSDLLFAKATIGDQKHKPPPVVSRAFLIVVAHSRTVGIQSVDRSALKVSCSHNANTRSSYKNTDKDTLAFLRHSILPLRWRCRRHRRELALIDFKFKEEYTGSKSGFFGDSATSLFEVKFHWARKPARV